VFTFPAEREKAPPVSVCQIQFSSLVSDTDREGHGRPRMMSGKQLSGQVALIAGLASCAELLGGIIGNGVTPIATVGTQFRLAAKAGLLVRRQGVPPRVMSDPDDDRGAVGTDAGLSITGARPASGQTSRSLRE